MLAKQIVDSLTAFAKIDIDIELPHPSSPLQVFWPMAATYDGVRFVEILPLFSNITEYNVLKYKN